jgi:hypothetical protein
MFAADVLGWMEVGELEGLDTRDGVVLPWAELVSFAMGFWELEKIEEALGTKGGGGHSGTAQALRSGGAHPADGGGGAREAGGA